ncbi:MAG TPA: hydrogenase/urease maturation nickel metallochaperone HypA [Phototrophicaceae bacterium]|jgi:Zn finger protein HypA/HybF involved in hydrogenase expression|nr:hydrogenase/urease maturation nickel metallochaperone HypA [Phototrophicaceae bacterium]
MHEFGIVENIVHKVLPQLDIQGIKHIAQVHFRRGSAFNEDALRQAYQATTTGTPLEGAKLIIDTVNLDYKCPCGYQQIITSDDLEGHMFICPECGYVHEVDEAHDLELIEIIAEMV